MPSCELHEKLNQEMGSRRATMRCDSYHHPKADSFHTMQMILINNNHNCEITNTRIFHLLR